MIVFLFKLTDLQFIPILRFLRSLIPGILSGLPQDRKEDLLEFPTLFLYSIPLKVVNYDGVSKNVTAVGFHEDGKWMFTGGEDCSARIWDLRYVCTWVQLCFIDCA